MRRNKFGNAYSLLPPLLLLFMIMMTTILSVLVFGLTNIPVV
jgi:hypothetical protein